MLTSSFFSRNRPRPAARRARRPRSRRSPHPRRARLPRPMRTATSLSRLLRLRDRMAMSLCRRGGHSPTRTPPEHVGGKIALIGPNVANNGTLSSADGQVIIAAGNQVGFAASTDTGLRGLNVYVGSVDANSGLALNTGVIDIPRADVTMAGENVDQNGLIDSSTSVSLNGRVDLLADYGAVGRV